MVQFDVVEHFNKIDQEIASLPQDIIVSKKVNGNM